MTDLTLLAGAGVPPLLAPLTGAVVTLAVAGVVLVVSERIRRRFRGIRRLTQLLGVATALGLFGGTATLAIPTPDQAPSASEVSSWLEQEYGATVDPGTAEDLAAGVARLVDVDGSQQMIRVQQAGDGSMTPFGGTNLTG